MHLLPVNFEFSKINSFYSLRADLRQSSLVSQIKLIFGADTKSIHKVKVTILVHQSKQGDEKPPF